MDFDLSDEFPHEVVQKDSKTGLTGAQIQTEYGAGFTTLDVALVVEELYAADAGATGVSSARCSAAKPSSRESCWGRP